MEVGVTEKYELPGEMLRFPTTGGEMLRAPSAVRGSMIVLQYTQMVDQRDANLLPSVGYISSTSKGSVKNEIVFEAGSCVPSHAVVEDEIVAECFRKMSFLLEGTYQAVGSFFC